MDVHSSQPRRSGDEEESQQAIAIAVLAAGRSSRMGKHNKLLAHFHEIALVRHSVRRAMDAGGQPIIVVTGHMANKVAAEINDLPVQKIYNPAFATGLSSSLKCAVGAVPSVCSGLLIHLADMPAITTDHLVKLMNAFRDADEPAIVRATANGERGNPVIIPRALFELLFALEGDVGARELVEMSGFPIYDVELGAAAATDVDTQDALEAAGGTFSSTRF